MSEKPLPWKRSIITKDGDLRPLTPHEMSLMMRGEVALLRDQVEAMQYRLTMFSDYMANTKGWSDGADE